MLRFLTLVLITLVLAGCRAAAGSPQAPVPITSETGSAPEAATGIEPASQPSTEAPGSDRAASLPDPASAQWNEVLAGFTHPLDLTHAGDERLFIVEQAGLIWIVKGDQRTEAPFLDIRNHVGTAGSEQGLLGLAFHPDYASNGSFFVNYTNRSGDTVISRFTVPDPESDQADPLSESILLEIPQPFTNHNGGGLAFGPDGYLYIGTGDGGSAGDPNGNAQNPDALLGKLLRIDVDMGERYAVPADNPFSAGGGKPEIWALGLRNPWRFSFDPLTGDLLIADVGQNTWEEVNYQPADSHGGENYGWSVREGMHPFGEDRTEGMIDPIAEYDHSLGCSVTGGHTIRDARLPDWNGVYLFGDYCSGLIWGLLPVEGGSTVVMPLFEAGATISSFGIDSLNRVYLVDHSGTIYRLDPAR
jgi:glucose/arabinose dehydrogenase